MGGEPKCGWGLWVGESGMGERREGWRSGGKWKWARMREEDARNERMIRRISRLAALGTFESSTERRGLQS